MEEFITVIAYLILLIVLIVALFANFFGILYALINYFFRQQINRYFLIRPLDEKYRKIISQYSDYYNLLGQKDKILFEKRTQKFIRLKEFIPRSGTGEVTDTMVALIAATAIQVTFGHPGVYFRHFRKILIYPDDYYSRIYRQYHKGEVNPGFGIIIISWKNFLDGYANKTDGINLGLHEMAHALLLENSISNREYQFLDRKYMDKWNKLIALELEKGRKGEAGFFRDYAKLNHHEFFAVAVEHFFEKPEEFKKYHSEMYIVLARLLNQDILKMQEKSQFQSSSNRL